MAAFDSANFSVDANGLVTFSGSGAAETLTGNSGGAVGPTGNNINTLGTGSITIVGNPGTSTLTTQLTGLTNHAIQVGAGTATLTQIAATANTGAVLQNNSGADPSYSTATYPSTTTINQILYSSANNVVSGLSAANRAVYTSGATGVPVATALAVDGQLIIGSTAGVPAAATLTAGTGISITNGSNSISVAVNGSVVGQTITGDSGGALSPTAGNWNLLGSGSITTVGSGSTLTTQLTGLTNHAVLVGAGTSTITKLGVGTNGQVLIGATTADPAFATLTSSDSSISFTTGANTLSLQVAGGSTTIKTITGNTGGAESPSAGNFNILGTGSITVAGSANTETVQLTGLTNHAIQIGAGTATLTQLGAGTTGQVLQTNTTADPTWSTATYPSTTTVSQILYSSATNTVSGLATANKAVLTTGATGIPVLTALATDGQVIIGSTAGVPAAATLTAGTGISITNGSNSISIAVNGSVVGQTITGDSGGALSPTAGNWNTLGSGSITIAGSGSTLTTQLTGLTNHSVLIGAGTATITKVAPSATSGVPLISQGASSDPTFGTAVVAGGGTGLTSATAYAVLCGGTTSTGNFQSVASVGTSGQVLVSNGAGALPTFQTVSASGAFSSIVIQTFTASGTYTPTANMKYCIIEAVGSGGGGGGTATATVNFSTGGGGGGAGGYSRKIASAATIGASQTVTIGAAGTGGSAGNNTGNAGADCSLGTICIAKGGAGGIGNSGAGSSKGGAGGVVGTGDLAFTGNAGQVSLVIGTAVGSMGNALGGASYFGATPVAGTAQATGQSGLQYGCGGAGGLSINTGAGAAQAGGPGSTGIVIVTEYI